MAEPKEKKELTPKEKAAVRTGPCVVCRCGQYAHSYHMDGFDHCTCDHTQWAHEPVGVLVV